MYIYIYIYVYIYMAAGSRAAPPPPMPMGPPQTPMLDTPRAFGSPWDKWFPKRCLGQMVFKTVPGATDFQKNAWGTCSPELHMEKEYIYIYIYILHIYSPHNYIYLSGYFGGTC